MIIKIIMKAVYNMDNTLFYTIIKNRDVSGYFALDDSSKEDFLITLMYDFLSEKFPRQKQCYQNDLLMPAYLNVAGLQSCFSSQHADVELDPIRFYPRSLTKEIYKLEKANNGQVICRICHKPIESFSDCSADHIVPYSKGGKTTLSNMQLAHKSCNSKKKDKIKNDDDENWIM